MAQKTELTTANNSTYPKTWLISVFVWNIAVYGAIQNFLSQIKSEVPRTFVSKSANLTSNLRSKISKMLIFHYISYKFDKISHLKNQIWHWKSYFARFDILKSAIFWKISRLGTPGRIVSMSSLSASMFSYLNGSL